METKMKTIILLTTLLMTSAFANLDQQAGFEATDEQSYFSVNGSIKNIPGTVTTNSSYTDAAALPAVKTVFRNATPFSNRDGIYVMVWQEGARSNSEAQTFCQSIGWKLPTADEFFQMQFMESINQLDDYMFGTAVRAIWVDNQYVNDAVATPNMSGTVLPFADLLRQLTGSQDYSNLSQYGLPPVCIYGDFQNFFAN
jgi:hypothetical protein